MSRLIDADTLEQSIKDWYCDPERCNSYNGIMCRACRIDDAISEIDRAPTVDAEPVRHGRWLDERPNTYTQKVKCSVCNGSAPFICMSADYYGRNMHGDFAKTEYCPNCGAKMDGDESAVD